jgi:hypothetical protein
MRQLALFFLAAGCAAAATLDGRVVEDHSGNPLASVELRVYRVGQPTLAAHLETDGSGGFHIPNLPDGEYRIEAAKPNYIGATVRMRALPSGLLIRLVRCGVISGRVLDGQNQPILGASVYVMVKGIGNAPPRPFTGGESIGGYKMARVDERGQYRLHGLPPGEYAVAVSYGSSTAKFGMMGPGTDDNPKLGSGVQLYPTTQRPQYFPVTGGEQYRNIDFMIMPSTLHNVKGKVELPDPKSTFWVALIMADQPNIATAVAATQPDGSFVFEGIAAGVYTLTASGPVRGYGGKGIVDRAPYFGRMPLSVGADLEGVTVAVQRARPVLFVLRPSGEGCPSAAQINLVAIEDFATQLDKSGQVTADKEMPIAELAPARYQVLARDLGESCYQPSIPTLDLSGPVPSAAVAVPIAPAGAIHGRLSGASDPTQYAVALIAADPEGASRPVQVAFPDTSGRFTFGGLRPGSYRLVAQAAGEASKARWVTDPARMIEFPIPAGTPTDLELPAPKRSQQ